MNNSKANILIIDDEKTYIDLLAGILSDRYSIVVAKSGEQALKRLQPKNLPDLILLDIMMPEMDGYEVCKRLKANKTTHDIPVIFLTAMTDSEDEQKGLEIGAIDYISKPVSPPILISRVQNHLRLKEVNDLLKQQNEILDKMVQERTQQLSQINQSLARFVPDEFLQFLQKKDITQIRLGDHVSKEMTVMFSDIRSFTSLSETMTSQEIFYFVNTYLKKIGPVIREHDGMIVKYLGDGMMAVFPNNPDDAIKAAIEMQRQIAIYNTERQRKERAPIRVGTGIHLGHLMFGMIGEENRIQGDTLSDNVNLTSRIEGLTKYYQVSLIISGEIFKVIDPDRYHIRFLDKIVVKGRNKPISIYEVFDNDPEDFLNRKIETKPHFEEGQTHYFAKEFGQAVKCFTNVFMTLPEDIPTRHYLQRASKCLLEGVPDDWEGIVKMDSK